MSDEQDLQVAAGLLAGKSEAWAALYEAYFDRVWRLAGRMIGPDASALADVVQETFMAAARSARTYDPRRGTLWLWLAGITRNNVATHFRALRRQGRLGQAGDLHAAVADHLAGRLRDGAPAPQKDCITAEEATVVRSTLAGLSDEYQSLLAERYLQDVPVEEIARRGDSTVEAVRSKLARARRAFRDALGHAGARNECQ
jgi:RNA polymerase sigma-70 factor (ECF subfamily)